MTAAHPDPLARSVIEAWNRRAPGPRPGHRYPDLADRLVGMEVDAGTSAMLRLSTQEVSLRLVPQRTRWSLAPTLLTDPAQVLAEGCEADLPLSRELAVAGPIGPLIEEPCIDCDAGWTPCPATVACPPQVEVKRVEKAMCPECMGLKDRLVACPSCLRSGLQDCEVCAGSGTVGMGRCPSPYCGLGRASCQTCGGAGETRPDCDTCDRRGEVRETHIDIVECARCSGSGERECPACRGTGRLACRACAGEGAFATWSRGTLVYRAVETALLVAPLHGPLLGSDIARMRGDAVFARPLVAEDAERLAVQLRPVAGMNKVCREVAERLHGVGAESLRRPPAPSGAFARTLLLLERADLETVRIAAMLPDGSRLRLDGWHDITASDERVGFEAHEGRPPVSNEHVERQADSDRRIFRAGLASLVLAVGGAVILGFLAPILLAVWGLTLLVVVAGLGLSSYLAPDRRVGDFGRGFVSGARLTLADLRGGRAGEPRARLEAGTSEDELGEDDIHGLEDEADLIRDDLA